MKHVSYVSWHETCACKCILDASVFNHRQCCNDDNADVNVKNWLTKVGVIMSESVWMWVS